MRWLADRGYDIAMFETAQWGTKGKLHQDFAAALSFPDYYGNNLDALPDCLRDVAERAYGWTDDATALVLVFENFGPCLREDPGTAPAVIEIIEDTGRLAALFGNRVLCLVQLDDTKLDLGMVGGHRVLVNPAEWHTSGAG